MIIPLRALPFEEIRLPRNRIDNAYIQGVALHRLTYETLDS
jgi:hypothetical protein